MKTKNSANYEVGQVIASFHRKKDIRVFPAKNTVEVLKGKKAQEDVGINTWGKLDFLRSKGWDVIRVNEFSPTNNKFLQKRFSEN